MSASIVNMPGVSAPDQPRELQPVAGVIEELELLLVDARSGKLRALAIATVRVGDEVGSLWCRPADGDCGHSLSSAISLLRHRYVSSQSEASRPRGETA